MNDLPFTLDQLKVLKAIAIEGNFKNAAKRLYLSQPAVSLQIQNLEKQLNLTLFDRNRSLKLTSAGKILLKYSNRILTLCEEADKSLNNVKSSQNLNLAIGANQITGTYVLPRLIGLFKQRYQKINIQLKIDSTSNIAWDIANGDINFGLLDNNNIPDEIKNRIKIRPYIEDEIVLIFPKKYLFSNFNKIKKNDLYKLKFIKFNRYLSIQQTIDNLLKLNKIELDRLEVVMELNSAEAIKNAVQAGLGVAFISLSTLFKEQKLKEICFIRIEDIYLKQIFYIIENQKFFKINSNKFFCF